MVQHTVCIGSCLYEYDGSAERQLCRAPSQPISGEDTSQAPTASALRSREAPIHKRQSATRGRESRPFVCVAFCQVLQTVQARALRA
ncbi:unnamed protein product [Lasius platythorax]|uniref:Uncharacterized protein n=1 Tax=Lasius platythorax TaxID=488582 RepID=A0AAV2NPZ5_9HYME